MFEPSELVGDPPPGALRTRWERLYDTVLEQVQADWSADYYDHVLDPFEADLAGDGSSDPSRPSRGSASAPGADLADTLEQLTSRPDLIADVDDDGLVSMVVAAERLGRWAAAVRGDGVLALWERWAHHHDPTDLPDDLEPRHRRPPPPTARPG